MNEEEKKTVEKMLWIYCKNEHNPQAYLCDECSSLKEYAHQRLSRCTYGESKPTCKKCPIHCYKPAMQEQMKVVMRYAGPRMILHNPILAIKHLVKNRKEFLNK